MKEFLKQHGALLLAFLLPIGLIVVLTLFVYLPSHSLVSKYNFVYATCDDDTYRYSSVSCSEYLEKRFSINDNKLTLSDVSLTKTAAYSFVEEEPAEAPTAPTVHLFYHDTKANESREIATSEALSLSLSGLLTSPDGLTVSEGYSSGSGGFFIFGGGGSSYGHYLTKGNNRSKLNLILTDEYSYSQNYRFIGWILDAQK